jgi:hydroxyacylglutathione hydrolase
LFCGDTLFGAGCGRLFEGTHEQMWDSLQKIAALNENTKFYCAHEYTLANLEFAREIDGTNKLLQQRIITDTEQREAKQPTIPSSIKIEKDTNPFLRPLNQEFCSMFNQENHQNLDALQIFTAIRTRKNNW